MQTKHKPNEKPRKEKKREGNSLRVSLQTPGREEKKPKMGEEAVHSKKQPWQTVVQLQGDINKKISRTGFGLGTLAI